jgi:DNA modification methylase
MGNTAGLDLMDIKQASEWASRYLGKNVTTSNIAYLLQYGRIKKIGNNGNALIDKKELINYYKSYNGKREINWKNQLGHDLNWALSFDNVKEAETTKHVHRLHPYKGKFIPQLVEYFLDSHKDNFKKEVYFKKGDIVLDPFCGSGTALVQANELGMYAIGIDISVFNSLISNVKVGKYNRSELQNELKNITYKLKAFIANSETVKFENELLAELAKFNNKFFPAPGFRYKVNRGQLNEDKYGAEKEKEFLPIFIKLVKDYKIDIKQEKSHSFLDKWYLQHIRNEIDFVKGLIGQIKNHEIKELVMVILSRTVRSCRATTHSDLATLKEPVTQTYYCSKHGKICKPLFSIFNWWERYSIDTIQRLEIFNKLRTDTWQICLTGDARTININKEVNRLNPEFAKILSKQKIQGIFSSPPYVGLIDYHEQHAYDLFGFKRRDDLEIGPLSKGQGNEARISYIHGIAEVLKNCKNFLADDYNIFLVANDKYNIYPQIAEKAGMKIVNQYRRPVLNRTERDKSAYSESIFHLKE